MINNEDKIIKVKQQVINICSQEHFVHHKWYVKYHLNIVEKISLQLCEKYSHADQSWVLLLVWMHDFEKIVRNGSSYQGTLGREFLQELDFSTEDIDKLLLDIDIFERKSKIKLSDARFYY